MMYSNLDIAKALEEQLVTQKPYLNPDLTLRDLSKIVQTTDKKLSVYLNQHLNTSFYDFINLKRINEFKRRSEHGDIENYSVVGLALECGFKSKSSFYRSFKKHLSTTPTASLKEIAK